MGSAAAMGLILLLAPGTEVLDRAEEALADFRPEDAVNLLELAKEGGPYSHEDHVRLYQQLGIAYAYLDRPEAAQAAFGTMLALDPKAAISYTLSPKVTFLFEEARREALEQEPATVDLAWPRDLTVDEPVPVDLEVVADPLGFLDRARLFYRKKGEGRFASIAVVLNGNDGSERVEIPPVAPESKSPATLELYLVAQDDRMNEVLRFGSADRPREVALAYEPPDPWYGKWWVWAIAGTVVAASAGAAAYAATRESPATVEGSFRVER